jgi:hypothetical protein
VTWVDAPSVPPTADRAVAAHRRLAGPVDVSRSGRSVALGLLVFAAIWLPLLAFNSLAPPVDNIEQLTWVRSLEWGYHKHPPLPTWLLWLPVQWLDLSPWAGYLLGAACTLGAFGSMWHLLARLRGPGYALVALLAALCIPYYNKVAAPARQELGGPIRVVSGLAAQAGALALQLPERPLVLIDGRHDRSPWVAPELVQRCSALQIGSIKELAGGRPVGAAFPTLAWNIVGPDPAAAPCPPLSVD